MYITFKSEVKGSVTVWQDGMLMSLFPKKLLGLGI